MRVRRFALLALASCAATLWLGAPAGAHSAPVVTTGNDISWPQCKRIDSLPSNQSFDIVGVNNGRPNTTNPCFTSELAVAETSSGAQGQPRTLLYVNTANPGDDAASSSGWPTSNFDITTPSIPDIDPYGRCKGDNDTACSWQYGYNMAHLDASARSVPYPTAYRWYLDVETSNDWSSSTTRNAADLEGMAAYFKNIGVKVGIYSTYRQWHMIVGSDYGKTVDPSGNILNGLPSWVPGASDEPSAQAKCNLQPFTAGGYVVMAQYLSPQVDLDYDVACHQT